MILPLKSLGALALVLAATGCVTERVVVREPGPRPYNPPAPAYVPPPPQEVESVYLDPPMGQPEPIACPFAPPPMLVEAPPPPPYAGCAWTGGYWVWQGTWVWAHGRWAAPPQPGYGWHHPYYENRDGIVIFIGGHWERPGVSFVPPPPSWRYEVQRTRPGIVPGPRPIGPMGVFVPPPPGSKMGLIVPAPIGTSPAVVTGAPPVVNVGMRITNNVNSGNTTIVNNVTNVTIMAPASATASGQAVHNSVPSQAHLAAAQPSIVRSPAPVAPRPAPAPRPVMVQPAPVQAAPVPRPAPQPMAPAPRPMAPAPRPQSPAVPPPAPQSQPAQRPAMVNPPPRPVAPPANPPPKPVPPPAVTAPPKPAAQGTQPVRPAPPAQATQPAKPAAPAKPAPPAKPKPKEDKPDHPEERHVRD